MKKRPPVELQIPFDRITYREGQLLASRDLQDDFGANQRLRRMHTRFLHDTWGIALGFTVDAEAGSDSVYIGPGYAIDQSAAEILLGQNLALPVPQTTVATDFMLVIGYQPESAYRELPPVSQLCAGATLDPRREQPLFNWRTPDTLNLGADVPLARIRVQNGGLVMPPDLSVRRYAARMSRPHIVTGAAEFTLDRSQLAGIQVDTSDAGFAETPQYFARLDAAGSGAIEAFAQFLANSAYIESATPKNFKYVVPGLAGLLFNIAVVKFQFVITWVGVEEVAGCEPVADLSKLFSLAGLLVRQPTILRKVHL
jgi:hypothetical protein